MVETVLVLLVVLGNSSMRSSAVRGCINCGVIPYPNTFFVKNLLKMELPLNSIRFENINLKTSSYFCLLYRI